MTIKHVGNIIPSIRLTYGPRKSKIGHIFEARVKISAKFHEWVLIKKKLEKKLEPWESLDWKKNKQLFKEVIRKHSVRKLIVLGHKSIDTVKYQKLNNPEWMDSRSRIGALIVFGINEKYWNIYESLFKNMIHNYKIESEEQVYNNTRSIDSFYDEPHLDVTDGEDLYSAIGLFDSDNIFYTYSSKLYRSTVDYPDGEAELLLKEREYKKKEKFRRLRKQIKVYESLESLEDTHSREPIPEQVRFTVWRRDKGKCVKCQSQKNLEFDHIIPVSKGGSNTARNIQILCEKCNRKKSDKI